MQKSMSESKTSHHRETIECSLSEKGWKRQVEFVLQDLSKGGRKERENTVQDQADKERKGGDGLLSSRTGKKGSGE